MSGALPPPPLALPPPQRLSPRLRSAPFWLAGIAGTVTVIVIGWNIISMGEQRLDIQQPDTRASNTAADAADLLKDAPAGNEIPPALRNHPQPHTPPAGPSAAPLQAPAPSIQQPQAGDNDMATQARKQAWAAYYQQLAQLKQDQMQRRAAWMAADTEVADTEVADSSTTGGGGNAATGGTGGGNYGQTTTASPLSNPSDAFHNFPGGNPERNAQRSFLSANGSSPATDYSPYTTTAPISPYEVKATDIVTGKLISALNSDSPGMLKAIVTKNVLDHATGNHILIPQGSTLVGVYDTSVAYGQHRVITAWQRIIYPPPCDQSLDLGSMPGSDQTGQAGFEDLTDNHLWQIFGNALLLSAFSAGIQLSQPPQSSFSTYNPVQSAGGAIGQQLGQLGQQFAQRGLSIPPTNIVRQGYEFSIMLTKDIAFAHPWRAGVCEPMDLS